MFCSRDVNSCVLNHPFNLESCEVMMIISTRDRVCFWMNLLNRKSFGYETWPTNRYIHGQYF